MIINLNDYEEIDAVIRYQLHDTYYFYYLRTFVGDEITMKIVWLESLGYSEHDQTVFIKFGC